MRILRPFLFAAVMVAAFVYLTSVAHWNLGVLLLNVRSAGHLYADASAASNFSSDEQNNIDIYKASRDATVNITSVVYRENWFFQLIPEKGTGSGFIINPEGQILTNNHVVSGGGSRLTVTLSDQKTYRATILWADPRNDLAMVKIGAGRKLPFLKLGDSDSLVVGQKVLAIGNPFNFQGTLTTGSVSSLDRTIEPEDGQRLWCSPAPPPRQPTAIASRSADLDGPTAVVSPPTSAPPSAADQAAPAAPPWGGPPAGPRVSPPADPWAAPRPAGNAERLAMRRAPQNRTRANGMR